MTDGNISLSIRGTVNGIPNSSIRHGVEVSFAGTDVVTLIPDVGDYKLPVNYIWDDYQHHYLHVKSDISHNHNSKYEHIYDGSTGIITPTLSDVYRLTAVDSLGSCKTCYIKINFALAIKLSGTYSVDNLVQTLDCQNSIALDLKNAGVATFILTGLGGSGLYQHTWLDLPPGVRNPGNIDTLTMLKPIVGTYKVRVADVLNPKNIVEHTFCIVDNCTKPDNNCTEKKTNFSVCQANMLAPKNCLE